MVPNDFLKDNGRSCRGGWPYYIYIYICSMILCLFNMVRAPQHGTSTTMDSQSSVVSRCLRCQPLSSSLLSVNHLRSRRTKRASPKRSPKPGAHIPPPPACCRRARVRSSSWPRAWELVAFAASFSDASRFKARDSIAFSWHVAIQERARFEAICKYRWRVFRFGAQCRSLWVSSPPTKRRKERLWIYLSNSNTWWCRHSFPSVRRWLAGDTIAARLRWPLLGMEQPPLLLFCITWKGLCFLAVGLLVKRRTTKSFCCCCGGVTSETTHPKW